MVGADDPRVVAVERFDLDDLRALVGQQHGAERAGQHLREVDDPDAVESAEDGGTASDWVLLTRNRRFLLKPSLVEATEPVVPRPDWRLWTDDYNNLVQVFRR